MSQLAELSRPFSGKYVKKAPQGKYGDYVPHSIINERLLQVVGPFDLRLVQIVRGHAPEIQTKKTTFPARADAIVGVVARLTITIDGAERSVEEIGTEDNPAMHNDAENLKNSMSDALKRCAMRFGLGLHLWSQDDYFLDRALADNDAASQPAHTLTTPEPAEEPSPEPEYTGAETVGDVIGPERGQKMEAHLREFGIKSPLAFARKVVKQPKLQGLESLLEDEAKVVVGAAKRQHEKEQAKEAA